MKTFALNLVLFGNFAAVIFALDRAIAAELVGVAVGEIRAVGDGSVNPTNLANSATTPTVGTVKTAATVPETTPTTVVVPTASAAAGAAIIDPGNTTTAVVAATSAAVIGAGTTTALSSAVVEPGVATRETATTPGIATPGIATPGIANTGTPSTIPIGALSPVTGSTSVGPGTLNPSEKSIYSQTYTLNASQLVSWFETHTLAQTSNSLTALAVPSSSTGVNTPPTTTVFDGIPDNGVVTSTLSFVTSYIRPLTSAVATNTSRHSSSGASALLQTSFYNYMCICMAILWSLGTFLV